VAPVSKYEEKKIAYVEPVAKTEVKKDCCKVANEYIAPSAQDYGTLSAARNYRASSKGEKKASIPDQVTKTIGVENGDSKYVVSNNDEKNEHKERAYKVRGGINIVETRYGEWKKLVKGSSNESSTNEIERVESRGDGCASLENPCEQCPFKVCSE
jgi:hypothetical protein